MARWTSLRTKVLDVIWYGTFHVAAFIAGWAIASTNAGEEMVPVGIGVAIVMGPVLAQLSKLARRLDRERHAVRVELDRFRYVWIWSTIWFGGAVIGAWAVADQLFYTYFVQGSILLMGAGGMAVAGWFARIAGRKREFLRVDLAAGVVEHVGAEQTLACSLDELGRFEVQTYRHRTGRGSSTWFRLVVPGFPGRVFADSPYAGGVRLLGEELQQRLDHLRDVSAIRRVLADTPTDGANYRAGISIADAIAAAVEDPARRAAAIRTLVSDPDPEIQKRATSATAGS